MKSLEMLLKNLSSTMTVKGIEVNQNLYNQFIEVG